MGAPAASARLHNGSLNFLAALLLHDQEVHPAAAVAAPAEVGCRCLKRGRRCQLLRLRLPPTLTLLHLLLRRLNLPRGRSLRRSRSLLANLPQRLGTRLASDSLLRQLLHHRRCRRLQEGEPAPHRPLRPLYLQLSAVPRLRSCRGRPRRHTRQLLPLPLQEVPLRDQASQRQGQGQGKPCCRCRCRSGSPPTAACQCCDEPRRLRGSTSATQPAAAVAVAVAVGRVALQKAAGPVPLAAARGLMAATEALR